MGEGFELSVCDWRLGPLAESGGRRRGKGKHGQHAFIGGKAGHFHWLSACMGFWERTLRNGESGERRQSFVFFSSPGVGRVNQHQQARQWWPVWASEPRPPGTDSEKCLTLSSDWRIAKPPKFRILLGGKRGSWHNFELNWQRVTWCFFFGCLRGNRL